MSFAAHANNTQAHSLSCWQKDGWQSAEYKTAWAAQAATALAAAAHVA